MAGSRRDPSSRKHSSSDKSSADQANDPNEKSGDAENAGETAGMADELIDGGAIVQGGVQTSDVSNTSQGVPESPTVAEAPIAVPVQEGGAIRVVETAMADESTRFEDLTAKREKTASTLAKWLLVILGGTIVLHYVTLTILLSCLGQDAYKPIEQVFNTVLPVLSGLVGSAITYYFTKEARSS